MITAKEISELSSAEFSGVPGTALRIYIRALSEILWVTEVESYDVADSRSRQAVLFLDLFNPEGIADAVTRAVELLNASGFSVKTTTASLIIEW